MSSFVRADLVANKVIFDLDARRQFKKVQQAMAAADVPVKPMAPSSEPISAFDDTAEADKAERARLRNEVLRDLEDAFAKAKAALNCSIGDLQFMGTLALQTLKDRK